MHILEQLEVNSVEAAFQKYLTSERPTPTENTLIKELIDHVTVNQVLGSTAGNCPVTGVMIASPCQLGSCRYHIKNHHAANCLLVYTSKQGNERINLWEQSVFYGIPLDKLEKNYQSALLKVQAKIFREWAEQEGLALFEFFNTNKVCCVCESILDNIPCAEYENLAYCSPECVKKSPTAQICLEKLFGLSYSDLQKNVPRCFDLAVSTAILSKFQGK